MWHAINGVGKEERKKREGDELVRAGSVVLLAAKSVGFVSKRGQQGREVERGIDIGSMHVDHCMIQFKAHDLDDLYMDFLSRT